MPQVAIPAQAGLPAVTLSLLPGHVYGLLGNSGVGKTRLLKALSKAAAWKDDAVAYVSQEAAAEWTAEDLQSTPYDLALINDVLGDMYIKVLRGLGFSKEMQDVPIGQLSGGWRQRMAIVLALLKNPDVLLADEITNGVDLAGLAFIEKRLMQMPDTIVIVTSHDRAFLANVCTDILYFKGTPDAALVLKHFPAGFDEYEQRMAELSADEARRVTAAEKQRTKAAAFVQDIKSKRAADVDPNKQKQAREKAEKMDKIGNFRSDGRRYKTYSLKKLDEKWLRLPEKTPLALEKARETRFNFVSLEEPVELAKRDANMITLDNVDAAYSGGPTVLRNITLSLTRVSRVALVGCNGHGKSSLISLIADVKGCPSVVRGNVTRDSSHLRVALVSQDSVDRIAAQYGKMTPIEYVSNVVLGGHAQNELKVRALLGGYGITGDLSKQPIELLSGGQKMRVAIASSFAKGAPTLLILDEPTQHLDLPAIDALVHGLNEWQGALLVSSHDRRFLQEVAFDSIWCMVSGKLKVEPLPWRPEESDGDSTSDAEDVWERVFETVISSAASKRE